MKKNIVLLLVSIISLQAAEIIDIQEESKNQVVQQYESAKTLIDKKKNPETNVEDTQDEFGNFTKEQVLEEYTKALNLYKQKAYQKAYENFNILFESNLDDVNINFYLGRSAFEIKKYDDAIRAFDRILFSKPDNNRVKLEIGRAYFMTKQYDLAKRYFKSVQQDPNTPENIKEALDRFLAVIDNNTKKDFLNGVILFGLNYDSNVKNTTDNSFLGLSPEEKIKDVAHQEVVVLNYKHKLSDLDYFKMDWLIFSKEFTDDRVTDNNVKLISCSPAYSKIYEGGISVDYAVFADQLWLDNDSNMRSFGIFPKVTYLYSEDKIIDFYFKSQKKLFQNATDKARNSWYNELGIGIRYKYSEKTSFGGVFVASNERETNDQQNTRVDVNRNSYKIRLNASHTIEKQLSIAPSISIRRISHKDANTLNNNTKQQDHELKLSIMGTYIYSPKWLLQLGQDYIRNNSNFNASVYDKHTFIFNMIRTF